MNVFKLAFYSSLLLVVAVQTDEIECKGTLCEDCVVSKSAIECNGNGDLVCGECKCNKGYNGKACEIHDVIKKRSTETCIKPNSSLICSGRGECINGQCACNLLTSSRPQKYTGRFCECNDYTCPYFNDQLCGGPNNGFCDCGECNCRPGYYGHDCSCIESKAAGTCMARNDRVCNNYGDCVCGRCICAKNSGMMGPTCEDCMYCDTSCKKAMPCVRCLFQDKQRCKDICNGFTYSLVDAIEPDLYKCSFREEDCLHEFGLSIETNERLTIVVKPGCVTNGGKALISLPTLTVYWYIACLLIVKYCLSNWISSS